MLFRCMSSVRRLKDIINEMHGRAHVGSTVVDGLEVMLVRLEDANAPVDAREKLLDAIKILENWEEKR